MSEHLAQPGVGDLPVLDAMEQRVLGCLLEKQVTVPAAYPLTANALRSACNQTSSREPVMDLDEPTVERVARGLRDRGLARIVWSDTGRRTLKYHQTLDEVVDLTDDERALLTPLLLRGPQTPGELRTRTERLFAFADRDAVEGCLRRMAGRDRPLVRELERRPGDRDHRWTHLLGSETDAPAAASSRMPHGPAIDREVPLRDGGAARDDRVRRAYAAVAPAYAEAYGSELDELPFERWLLDLVVERAAGGPIVDVGCGPGHVTAHLAARGADATGLDLTPEMVDEARRRFPEGRYEVGDLRRLLRPTSAPGWSAVLGWYSLIHLAGSELADAVDALSRPLVAGGWLVLALHAGTDVRHASSWFDAEVDLDALLHEPAEVSAALTAAGLVEIEWYRRSARAARGESTERLYVLGRKPG